MSYDFTASIAANRRSADAAELLAGKLALQIAGGTWSKAESEMAVTALQKTLPFKRKKP